MFSSRLRRRRGSIGVERFFAELIEQIRRGVHPSTRELEHVFRAHIKTVNDDPKPFQWTKSADKLLASVKAFAQQPLKLPKSSKLMNPDTRGSNLALLLRYNHYSVLARNSSRHRSSRTGARVSSASLSRTYCCLLHLRPPGIEVRGSR